MMYSDPHQIEDQDTITCNYANTRSLRCHVQYQVPDNKSIVSIVSRYEHKTPQPNPQHYQHHPTSQPPHHPSQPPTHTHNPAKPPRPLIPLRAPTPPITTTTPPSLTTHNPSPHPTDPLFHRGPQHHPITTTPPHPTHTQPRKTLATPYSTEGPITPLVPPPPALTRQRPDPVKWTGKWRVSGDRVVFQRGGAAGVSLA
nr:extensin-like [Penaeus vannamei]